MKSFSIAAVFAATTLAALASAQTPSSADKDVFEKACTACHGLEPIAAMTGNKEEWTDVVEDMIAKGAEIGNADKDKIVAYLVATYPKKAEKKISARPAAIVNQRGK